ncbi:hypothetical protein FBUS_00954 [Fasciolopsis buskii]|uniref:phosphopyruvate hydratase n=1 Tax=Fasciolopsis buskii TaxID=27845 RepID=A0A8E0VNA0_9TREM|nr:hypothetical protein FBUS_00954 [Fasciolopsis buski]
MSSPLTEKQLKAKAIQYYRENSVLMWIEQVLNKMFMDNPKDTAGYLSDFFKTRAQLPEISNITVTKIINGTAGMLYKIQVQGRWLQQTKTLIKFLYEVPRQHDQALTSVESDDHLEMENLIEEEILQMVSEGPLNSRILKMVDEKLRCWYDQRIPSQQKQQDPQCTVNSERREFAPKQRRQSTKPVVQGNKAKTSRPATGVAANEIIDLASPIAFHCSALSLAMLMATCRSSHMSTEPHEAVMEIANKVTELPHSSGFRSSRKQLPLPIITIMNGLTVGTNASGQQCKCVRHILLIPKPTLSPNEICEGFLRCRQQIEDMLRFKPLPGSQILCPNGAPAIPMDRPEKGLDFVLDALQQLQLKEQFVLGLNLISRAIFDPVKGKYEPVSGNQKTAEEMVNYYADLVGKYPQIRLLIEPFRKEDAQCWAMLHERIGAQTLLASSNMPQSIVSSGSDRGSGSGSGPRKLSTLRPPSQLGTPSSPSIAAVARWSSTKLRLVTQDLTETGRTSDDPLDEVNGTTPTKRREEECNMSRLLAVEGDICVSDEQTTERTEGSKVQVCSSAWLVSSKAVIDCCLITELIQAINYVQSENKQAIFDVDSMKYAGFLLIDIAFGLSFSFISFGGLGLPEHENRLLHWFQIVSKYLAHDPTEESFRTYGWSNFGRAEAPT